MKLGELIATIPGASLDGHPDVEVSMLVEDSRSATPGTLFAARPGAKDDGTRFVADAVRRGAEAVLAQVARPEGIDVPWIRVPSVRRVAGEVAATLLGRPADRLRLVAITGTNGKTTTATLVASMAEAAEGSAGLIGTIEYRVGRRTRVADRTTPEAWRFQALLEEMVRSGVRTCVTEASSHALDQGRLDGCTFDAAVFTNLTRDHFDYHGDFESYYAAKRKLFDLLRPESGRAVVNLDDPYGERLAKELGKRAITFSTTRADADVRPRELRLDLSGTAFRIDVLGEEIGIESPLVGRTNLQNLLAAAVAAKVAGLPENAISKGAALLDKVPGRLERVAVDPTLPVFVDFAHTEDALVRTIEALRELSDRRITVVFGCGGDKDKGKRAPMGAAVGRLADYAVVTSDNPRSEDPLAIVKQVEEGLATVPEAKYVLIPDRRLAIGHAIAKAGERDCVLIAGKGHEREQIFADHAIAFSDQEVAAEALRGRLPEVPRG